MTSLQNRIDATSPKVIQQPSEEQPQSQETASLVKRLAGPSSGKAGLTKDQTEINRIIAEASKGSKFYENEKKKDKELTARIDKILKQRDEAIRDVDLSKIEKSVGQLIAQIESERDLTQIIVHVDMDAFYASVELLDKPDLEGKPFAVGRGVLTTASYEARRYGVRSGMAGFIAKKLCPELIFMPNRFSRYSEMSKKIMDIFYRYDPHMCPAGCDEGYLNITSYCQEHLTTAEECVQKMRSAVLQETKLTVSAGIAPNKMLAKICSDKNKPNGQFQLQFDPQTIKEFMRDLPIRKVPGVGRVNERLLDAIGIQTCGDIFKQRAVVSLMDKQFGLIFLLQTYLGIASNVVAAHRREERKSIGAERTFSTLSDKDQILKKLDEVAIELEKDMEESGWVGRTVTLKYKLDTYQVFTRAKSSARWISKKEDLFSIGKELLLPELPLSLRLIGLRMTKLKDLRDERLNAGIKRFFETNKEGSPRKRIKTQRDNDDEDMGSEDEILVGSMEEHMPGFHEMDEADYQVEDRDELAQDGDPDYGAASSSITNLPNSAMGGVAALKQIFMQAGQKLEKGAPQSPQTIEPERHNCPICNRTLETDNRGLNSHIDFCLSRGVIMEAQSESNQSIKPETRRFVGWPKPASLKGESKPIKRGHRPK